MALLYGNPNQITFTFDATYNSIGEMDTDAANIMLGRFVLWQDNTNGLSHIYMRRIWLESTSPASPHTEHYQHIGIVPVASVDQSTITGLSLDIVATQVDNGGTNNEELKYILELHTTITTAVKTWDASTKEYKTTINTQDYKDSVDITFADSDEINFFTDEKSNIKLGLKTQSITTNKIADQAITTEKVSFTTEQIQEWLNSLGLNTIIQNLQKDIEAKTVSVESEYSLDTGIPIATIRVGNPESAKEYEIYIPETQSGIDEDSLQKYLQDNEYTTKDRVEDLIDSRDYVTPGFVAEKYVSKDYATENFITKTEVTGTIRIIGFDEYRNETESLLVHVYNISGTPIFNNPIGSDITLNNIPYGKYFVAKVNAIGDTGTDYQIDETYPKIYCTVGYNSVETIDVSDWASYKLNSNSWTKIKQITELGSAPRYWSLGDTKEIVINNTSYKATILDFNHDGDNTITFGLCNFEDGVSVSKNSPPCLYEGEHSSYTVAGVIGAKQLQEDINAFATIIKSECGENNLKTVNNKYYYIGNEINQDFSTISQYVFIPSDKEIIGTWNSNSKVGVYPTNADDKQYAFFELNPSMSLRLYNRSHNPNFVSPLYSWRLAFRRISEDGLKQLSSYAPRNEDSSNNIKTYILEKPQGVLQHSAPVSVNTFDYLFMWVVG